MFEPSSRDHPNQDRIKFTFCCLGWRKATLKDEQGLVLTSVTATITRSVA